MGDNANVIIYEILKLLRRKSFQLYQSFPVLDKYKDMPALGYTRTSLPGLLQQAEGILWIMDLMLDVEELDFVISRLRPLGNRVQQDSGKLLALFNRDHEK